LIVYGDRRVTDVTMTRLPKGRHSLTREQVTDAQRLRLAIGMATAMEGKGYVGTPVAEILKRAGVSRETFYQLYDDKLACFLDALDLIGALLVQNLNPALGGSGTPLERAERAVEQYLTTIADNPAFARLYLVEVHAAGPVAMTRRANLQAFIVDGLAGLIGAKTKSARFACQMYVAAIASLVTVPVVTADMRAVEALRKPLVEHLRALAREHDPSLRTQG
jgi:AcrR family transcriptional regulator